MRKLDLTGHWTGIPFSGPLWGPDASFRPPESRMTTPWHWPGTVPAVLGGSAVRDGSRDEILDTDERPPREMRGEGWVRIIRKLYSFKSILIPYCG